MNTKETLRSLFLLAVALAFLPVILALIPILVFVHKPVGQYLKTVAIGIDQFGGSVLYGQENFTVSTYTHFLCMIGNKKACIFEKVIDFFFGKNHCEKSFNWEVLNDKTALIRVENEFS